MKKITLTLLFLLLLLAHTPIYAQQQLIEEFIGQDVVVVLAMAEQRKTITGKIVSANEYGVIISTAGKKIYINHDHIIYIEPK